MSGFISGADRRQGTMFPAQLEDYVAEDNLVRAVDVFVDGLDLGKLGFGRVVPLEKGRPCYRPATLLKIYIYGYLNRVPSSRRLHRSRGSLDWVRSRPTSRRSAARNSVHRPLRGASNPVSTSPGAIPSGR